MAEQPPSTGPSRRVLMVLALGAATYATLRFQPWRQVSALRFSEVEDLPPFRRLDTVSDELSRGSGSATGNVLIGLPDPTTEAVSPSEAQYQATRAAPCAALFGEGRQGSEIPIAYFTDIRCPICRVLEADLDVLLRENDDIRLVTHEYPVFGESSIIAARALAGAATLGSNAELRRRLQRGSVVVDDAYIANIAGDLGFDPARLSDAMYSDAVVEQLQISRALAGIFGFHGTPALVIGRTAILGAQPRSVLARVIEEERASGPLDCA